MTSVVDLSLTAAHANCFVRNLESLNRSQPELAALLRQTDLPPGAMFVAGRDHTPHARFRDESGRMRWFGGSSMPSISAGEVLADIPSESGNVVLPSILTGMEPLLLLQSLPHASAVFVVEQDASRLVMALHMHDLSAEFASGRLLLFALESFSESLIALLRRFPGYALPRRMITSPLIARDHAEEVQKKLEAAAQAVAEVQQNAARAAVHVLSQCPVENGNAGHRIALLLAAESCGTEDLSQFRRALSDMKVSHVVAGVDCPRLVQPAGILEQLAALRPNLVLLLNGVRHAVLTAIPESLPVASWYWPGAPSDRADYSRLRPNHWLFTATRQQRENLLTGGVDPARVRLCAAGVQPAQPARADGNAGPPLPACLVVAPALDDQPQAMQVTLPGHVQLWNRLRQAAQDSRLPCSPVDTRELVRSAMRAVGMEGDDAKIVEFFASVFTERLVPAFYVRAAMESGHRWTGDVRLLTPDEFLRALSGRMHGDLSAHVTPLVVLPVDWPDRFVCLLHALCQALPVVLQGDLQAWCEDWPGGDDLVPALAFYSTPDRLPSAITAAKQISAAQRHEIAELIRTRYSLTERLTVLARTVHELAACPVTPYR